MSRARVLLAAVAAASVLVALGAIAPLGGTDPPRGEPHAPSETVQPPVEPGRPERGHQAAEVGLPGGVGPQGRVPQFVVTCGWSHRAPDDPIVSPGHAGHSHLHDFFGNTATDATSTGASLLDGDTTCDTVQDTAAYWTPVLLHEGQPVEATHLDAYYRPGPGVDPVGLQPYPLGLAMLAGDPEAVDPQPTEVVGWHCGSAPQLHPTPPTCPAAAPLTLRAVFPDCWNGRETDSDDHRSHVTYSTEGACPRSHPVAIPQLIVDVTYRFSGPPDALALSSGPLTSVHADFLNAWEPTKLLTEVDLCLRRGAVCGVVPSRATG